VVKATIKANTPVGYRLSATIQEPAKAPVTTYVVPKGFELRTLDIYVRDPATEVPINCCAVLVKNDVEDVLKTDPLNALTVTNPAKPRVPTLVFDEFEKLSVDVITLESPTADKEVTFYLKVDESKKTTPAVATVTRPSPLVLSPARLF